MKFAKITFLLFVFFTFFLGLYLYTTGKFHAFRKYETMQGKRGVIDANPALQSCPDLLVKRGNKLLMFNTGASLNEGVNPIVFPSMNEYIAYNRKQEQNGVKCPMLFVQEEYDAQGNQVYRARPSPFDLGGGLSSHSVVASMQRHPLDKSNPTPYHDASRDDPPYNQNMYPGFDASSQYQGRYTSLDKVHDSTMLSPSGSLNPADPNWAGVLATQDAINKGIFEENNVSIYIP